MAKPVARRSTLTLSTPIATDPVALERRKTASRLRRARPSLEAFLHRLEALHGDKTGSARTYYGGAAPCVQLAYEADKAFRSTRRTKKEASTGCTLCAAWLEKTADLRQRIAELLDTPLPARDPSYTGPPLSLAAIAQMGKARSYYFLQDRPRRTVGEMLADREERQAERRARASALLQDFQRELAEDAEKRALVIAAH